MEIRLVDRRAFGHAEGEEYEGVVPHPKGIGTAGVP